MLEHMITIDSIETGRLIKNKAKNKGNKGENMKSITKRRKRFFKVGNVIISKTHSAMMGKMNSLADKGIDTKPIWDSPYNLVVVDIDPPKKKKGRR